MLAIIPMGHSNKAKTTISPKFGGFSLLLDSTIGRDAMWCRRASGATIQGLAELRSAVASSG